MRSRTLVLVAAPIVVAACSSASDPGRSAPEPSAPTADEAAGAASIGAAVGAAKAFVQMNAEADTNWKLLARKFYNNDTEVVSFYEPTPGNVVAVGAGHPTGAAMVQPSSDPEALLGDEAIPQPLADALARKAAGVGIEQYAASHSVDVSESVASSVVPETAVAAPANVTPFVVGTGYCDTGWKNDFPSNMTGTKTSYCRLTNPTHFPPTASNGNRPQWIAAWNTSSNGAVPYNSSAGCSCSCRTPVGFQQLHFNPAGVSNTNEWENFASVCPVLGAATVTLTSSAGNNQWTVPEDSYFWQENVGSVSCVISSCTKTHDIASWSLQASSQVGGGLVNLISDAYGP